MKQYGIDGVFVQRFLVELRDPSFDTVIDHVRQSASATGRAYAVCYDLSGAPQDRMFDILTADWKRLVDEQKVTADDRYLRHNGKPVHEVTAREDLTARIERFFGPNKIFVGIAVEMLRRHSGIMNLIVRSFFETNRKGFDLPGRGFAKEANNRAAISTAAQKCSHFRDLRRAGL